METDFLRCERCQTILGGETVNLPEPVECPGCRTPLLAHVFPAFFHAPATEQFRQEAVTSDEDASCFFHPRKKAVVPCANCGRFLCGLCDLEFDGRHLCPTCVESSRSKEGALSQVVRREHMRYDSLALALAFAGIIWPFSLFTATASLYFAIRYWNTPSQSLIPRGHGRQGLALILSLAQLGAWAFFIARIWAKY